MTAALILLCVFLNTVAQLLLKIGMQRIGHFALTPENFLPISWKVATSPPIMGGMFCYIFSVAAWMVVLSRIPVSLAYPMSSLGYVATAVAAWWILGESLGPMRLGGIAVIMVGVWMMSRTA